MAAPSQSSLPHAAGALLAGLLFLAPETRRDLDVGIPPGSALDWGQQFPGTSPPRVDYLASTKAERRKQGAERSRSLGAGLDARRFKAAHSTPILSILTWDIPLHLQWIKEDGRGNRGPHSAPRASSRPPLPRYGDTLYWTTLAPLFRVLLHPRQISPAEVTAHLLELGDVCRPALLAASNEAQIRDFCLAVIPRLEPGPAAKLECEKLEDTPRHGMLKNFARAELLRHEPYDVTVNFADRLFLLSELFYPIIADLAAHSTSIEVRRNAVSALARFDTRAAQQRLLRIAEGTQDQVVLVRALAGLGRSGRHGARLEWEPLIARLAKTTDPVLRVALIGALGRSGAQAATEPLLAALERAREAYDADQLQALLLALPGLINQRNRESIAAAVAPLVTELRKKKKPFAEPLKSLPISADVRDPEDARLQTITQLAVMLQSRLVDQADESSRLLYSLIGGRKRLKSYQGRAFGSLLEQLMPAAQLRFFEGLAAQRDEEGQAFLRNLAALQGAEGFASPRQTELALSFGSIALGLLPPGEQAELARQLIESPRAVVRLHAFQALQDLGDRSLVKTSRGLLKLLEEADLDLESAATKLLYQKAIQELSRQKQLTPADALAWQRHLNRSAQEERNLLVSDEFTRQVDKIIELASRGAQKALLKREIDALLELTPESAMEKLLAKRSRGSLRSRILKFLGGAKAHSMDRPYLQALSEEIHAFVFMYEPPTNADFEPGVNFEPPVNLKQTLLLAMGAMQHPAITELIHNAVNSDQEPVRAVACIATGMSQDPRAAKRLLPALESTDAFTRLSAAQALSNLVREVPFVDWVSGSSAQRALGIQEIRELLAEQEGR